MSQAKLFELGEPVPTAAPPIPEGYSYARLGGRYRPHFIHKDEEFRALLERVAHADVLGFDTESAGPMKVYSKESMINVFRSTYVGFSVAFPDGYCAYVDIGHAAKGRLPLQSLSRFFKAVPADAHVWVHNLKYELLAMKCQGIAVPTHFQWGDSQLSAYAGHFGVEVFKGDDMSYRYGLKALTLEHLKHQSPKFNDVADNRLGVMALRDKPLRRFAEYACQDAWHTMLLGMKFDAEMFKENCAYVYRVEVPLVSTLANMEFQGLRMKSAPVAALHESLATPEAEIRTRFERKWQVSISSPAQLTEFFYGKGLWDASLAEQGKEGPSINKKSLEAQLESPSVADEAKQAARDRMEFIRYNKLKSTYTWNLYKKGQDYPDGKVHSSINQTGTVTGRFSTSDPSSQNLPQHGDLAKGVKACFVPDDGYEMFAVDLGQAELRLMAEYERDKLFQVFADGGDPHAAVGEDLGIGRSGGKTVNFATIYGLGAKELGKRLGQTAAQAEQTLQKLNQRYPGIERVKKQIEVSARERGWVKMISGVYRRTPGLAKRAPTNRKSAAFWRDASALRQAQNKPFQGGVAEIMKIAMPRIERRLGNDGCLLAQVHDEGVGQALRGFGVEAVRILQEEMTTAVKMSVPMEADGKVGMTWAECK